MICRECLTEHMTTKFNPNCSLIPDVSSFYTTRGRQVPVSQPACGVFRSVIHVYSLTRVYRVHILKGLAFFCFAYVHHRSANPSWTSASYFVPLLPSAADTRLSLFVRVWIYSTSCCVCIGMFPVQSGCVALVRTVFRLFVQEVTRADSTTAQHFKRCCSLILLIVSRCVFYYLQNIGRSVPGKPWSPRFS